MTIKFQNRIGSPNTNTQGEMHMATTHTGINILPSDKDQIASMSLKLHHASYENKLRQFMQLENKKSQITRKIKI